MLALESSKVSTMMVIMPQIDAVEGEGRSELVSLCFRPVPGHKLGVFPWDCSISSEGPFAI